MEVAKWVAAHVMSNNFDAAMADYFETRRWLRMGAKSVGDGGDKWGVRSMAARDEAAVVNSGEAITNTEGGRATRLL